MAAAPAIAATGPARKTPRSVRLPPVSGDITLLELVQAVSRVTPDEREVVATVVYMLRTGRVRLCGNFRGELIEIDD